MLEGDSRRRSAMWGDALPMRRALVQDGWLSPDTYDGCFAPVSDDAAVYLFLLYQRDEYAKALIAYVGMSGNLKQRWSGHEILSELYTPECWPMRWFKPTAHQQLRAVEREYIAHFNPPWNIVGRRRGFHLS